MPDADPLYLANAVEQDLSRASSFAINDDGDGKEDRLLGERSCRRHKWVNMVCNNISLRVKLKKFDPQL